MPTKITFNPKVEVRFDIYEGGKVFYRLNEDKTEEKMKKFEVPDIEEVKSDADAEKVISYIRRKLDFDRLKAALGDMRFCTRFVSLEHLEVILGKALISGELQMASDLVTLARQNPKYANLYVTNAYFEDFAKRGKRNFAESEDYMHLMFMTLIRQGDEEIIKFALKNRSPNYTLEKAYVKDGDMVFSRWLHKLEVNEMSKEEQFNECIPRTKIFDSYFEHETPLSAILKNRLDYKVSEGELNSFNSSNLISSAVLSPLGKDDVEGAGDGDGEEGGEEVNESRTASVRRFSKLAARQKSKEMIYLLLEHEADVCGNHYQAFKVAARYGLLAELKVLLRGLKSVFNRARKKLYQQHIQNIYVALVAQAAIENRRDIIEQVRQMVDVQSSMQKKNTMAKNGNNRLQMNLKQRFPEVMNLALKAMVADGCEKICTYRYRIMNGIYNLLVIQQELATANPLKSNASIGGTPNLLIRTSTMKVKENLEVESMFSKLLNSDGSDSKLGPGISSKPKVYARPAVALPKLGTNTNKKCILRVNEVTHYKGPMIDLLDPTTGGVNTLVNAIALNSNFSSAASDAGSQRSLTRKSSTSSTYSLAGGNGGKKSLIKTKELHQWFTSIISQNDYQGEGLVLVLFALGLRQYFKPYRKEKRANDNGNESEASSEWGAESTGVSDVESEANDQNDGNQTEGDASSVRSGESDKLSRSTRSSGTGRSSSGRKRRKSTFSEVLENLGHIGNQFATKVQKKFRPKGANSREKVEALELAAEFGSAKILNELCDLIAPQIDKNVLKCVFLSTMSNKNETGKLLLNKITEHFDAMMVELQQRKADTSESPNKLKRIDSKVGAAGASSSFLSMTKAYSKSQRQQRDRKAEFTQAINDYFEEMETFEAKRRALNNEQHLKNKVKLKRPGRDGRTPSRISLASIDGISARRSISQTVFRNAQKARKLSVIVTEAVTKIGSKFTGRTGRSTARSTRTKSDSSERGFRSSSRHELSSDEGSKNSKKSGLRIKGKDLKQRFKTLRKSITENVADFTSTMKREGLRQGGKDIAARLRGKTGTGLKFANSSGNHTKDTFNSLSMKAPLLTGGSNFNSNPTLGTGANGTSDSAALAFTKGRGGKNNQKKLFDNDNYDEHEEELKSQYSRYLESVLRYGLKFGSYEVCRTVLDNRHINKTKACEVVLDLLKISVSKDRVIKKEKYSERPLKALVDILQNHLPKEVVNFAVIGREITDIAVNTSNDSLGNWKIVIEEIVAANGKFFRLDDMYKVVKGSYDDLAQNAQQDAEWEHWPEAIFFIYDHLLDTEKANVGEIRDRMKRDKISNKLPEDVVNCLHDIFAKHNIGEESNVPRDKHRRKSGTLGSISGLRRRSSLGNMMSKGPGRKGSGLFKAGGW